MANIESLEIIKAACAESKCEECPFATGIYMEIMQDYQYFCNLRGKMPRDWNLDVGEKPVLRKAGEEIKEKKKKTTTRKKKTK